jgi:hypothetical protein
MAGALSMALGVAWANSADAARPTADAAERERIAGERAVIETRYAEERLACQKNFVVTSCVDAVRRRERTELGRLRQQEALLDEAERRRRAADRLAAIQAKVDAEAQRQRELAHQPPKPRALPPHAPRAGAAPAASAPRPPSVASAAEREAREAASRERYEARQRQAQAHREEVERRSAQRAQHKQSSTPLPLPAGASAP